MSGQAFKHQALSSNTDEFRLIRILPSSQELSPSDSHSPVSCDCFHTRFDGRESYVALSYTWGNERDTSSVLLNGKLHTVRTNLEQALRHLRSTQNPVVIWIDALCINQEDQEEKTAQVARMRDIYQSADRVIAWVGVSEKGHLAARWLQNFGERLENLASDSISEARLVQILRTVPSPTDSAADLLIHEFIQDVIKSLLSHGEDARSTRAAVSELIHQPYWSRIWVVQEVALGKRIDFQYGQHTISEGPLYAVLRLLRSFTRTDLSRINTLLDTLNTEDIASIHGLNAINMLKVRRAPQRPEMMYLIRMTAAFNSKIDRDRIFALLSCAQDSQVLGLRPDYSPTTSTFQIYIRTTLALLNHGYFDIWSMCGLPNRHPDLPTWSPDYRRLYFRRWPLQERALDRSDAAGLSKLQPAYSASGIRRADFDFTHLPNTNLLCIRAIPVEKVEVMRSRPDPSRPGLWLDELRQLFRECREHMADQSIQAGQLLQADQSLRTSQSLRANPSLQPAQSPDSDHLLESIIRTAVADQRTRNGSSLPRLPSSTVQEVMSFLRATEDWRALTAEDFAAAGLRRYANQLRQISRLRRPFRTARHIGIGPDELRKGDLIYLVPGAQVPFAFRVASPLASRLVGEVYLHGAMDGERAGEGTGLVPLTIC